MSLEIAQGSYSHLEQAETGLETLSRGVSAALGPVRRIFIRLFAKRVLV